jgi:hypothetical protein
MKEKIDFDWSKKLEITDINDPNVVTETFPADKLERSKYAGFLTQYLISSSRDESKSTDINYVLNLNSEWGAGKSYFLRRWAHDLKSEHPVVYIDAWKQDYSEDPLMTVVSSLISQLREQAGIDENDIKIKAPKKLIGLLKAAASSLARGVSKRYLGIDPVKIMNSDDEDETIESDEKDSEGKPIDMGLAASKVVDQLINEHDSKAIAINNLKDNVKKWIEIVVQDNKLSNPAFVFIDELDRCRPNYAVEMLETIKHIFDIPGVVFVVATDTEQLQHAVKAIYGVGFDARVYLSRFFNSRFSLKAPNLDNLLEVHCDTKKLSQEYFDKKNIDIFLMDDDLMIKNITTIFNAFSLSPRSAIQITERLIATISNLSNNKIVDILMLTILLCIREKDEELSYCIFTNTLDKYKGADRSSLSTLLINKFDIVDASISFKFVKNNYFERYVTNHNFFKDGCYDIDLEYYISNAFNEGNDIFIELEYLGAEKSQLKSCIDSLNSIVYPAVQSNSDEIAKRLFEFIYSNTELREIEIGEYRDLVELATAIDWAGDPKENINYTEEIN